MAVSNALVECASAGWRRDWRKVACHGSAESSDILAGTAALASSAKPDCASSDR